MRFDGFFNSQQHLGEGLFVTQDDAGISGKPNTVVATYYGHDAAGKQFWLICVGTRSGKKAELNAWITKKTIAGIIETDWGKVILTDKTDHILIEYKPLTGQPWSYLAYRFGNTPVPTPVPVPDPIPVPDPDPVPEPDVILKMEKRISSTKWQEVSWKDTLGWTFPVDYSHFKDQARTFGTYRITVMKGQLKLNKPKPVGKHNGRTVVSMVGLVKKGEAFTMDLSLGKATAPAEPNGEYLRFLLDAEGFGKVMDLQAQILPA